MRVLAYLLMRAKVKLAYRGDFALSSLGDLVVTTVGLFLVATIFHHVPEVRGYDVHEVLVCWGMAEASLGVFWVLFQGLYAVNRQYILGGDLDRVLLRPLDPYLQILLDHVHIEDVPVIGLGLAVLAFGVSGGGVEMTWDRWLLLPVFVLSGSAVIGGCLTAVTALGFWMHHQGSAIGLAYQLTVYGRYPLARAPGHHRAAVRVRGFHPGDLLHGSAGLVRLGARAAAGGRGVPGRGLRVLDVQPARVRQRRHLISNRVGGCWYKAGTLRVTVRASSSPRADLAVKLYVMHRL